MKRAADMVNRSLQLYVRTARATLRLAVATGAAILLVAAACVSNPEPEPIGSVRAMYDGSLSPELAASTFRHIDRLFPTRTVQHGSPASCIQPHAWKHLVHVGRTKLQA